MTSSVPAITSAVKLQRTTPIHRLLAGLAVAGLTLAACGGSDGSSDTDTATDTPAEAPTDDASSDTSSDASGDGSEVLADNEPRDAILDEVDPDGDLDSAMSSLSPETRYGIVAGQLEPEPTVEVNGTDIRLVFDGGTVENGFIDCIVAGVTQLDTETLTLVYPDGEETC